MHAVFFSVLSEVHEEKSLFQRSFPLQKPHFDALFNTPDFCFHQYDSLMQSNIGLIFFPPPPRDIDSSECVPCTLTQSIVATGGGAYLCLLRPFNKGPAPHTAPHPRVWRVLVRAAGAALLVLGLSRGLEAYRLYLRPPQ